MIPSQRPYGAWLYYGNILTLSKPDLQQSLEMDVGAVGPLALGRPIQAGFHRFLRSINGSDSPPDPKGWGNQINNQPGLQLFYQDKWRLKFLEGMTADKIRYFDLVPQVSAALGTVAVNASAGATARLGFHVPNDFPDATIPPAPPPPAPPGGAGFALAALREGIGDGRAGNLQRASGESSLEAVQENSRRASRSWEAYLFGRADRRYVAFNTFLDGNLPGFGQSHSVPKEPFVTDLQVGTVLGIERWRVTVTVVDRSREFVGQHGHQRYASLNVSHHR